MHQHVIECYFTAGFAVELFYDDNVVFGDFILLTTGDVLIIAERPLSIRLGESLAE